MRVVGSQSNTQLKIGVGFFLKRTAGTTNPDVGSSARAESSLMSVNMGM